MRERNRNRVLWSIFSLFTFLLGAVVSGFIGNRTEAFLFWLFNEGIHNSTFLAALVGALATLAGLLVGMGTFFSWYRMRRTRRELSWSFIADILPVNTRNELTSNVQILYESHPILDAHLIVLKLWNSGRTPILTKDYDDPIYFSFGVGVRVASVAVVNTEPPGLKVSFTMEEKKVLMKPLLLNSQDSITFQVIVVGDDIKVDADARIAGLAQLKLREGKSLGLALQGVTK